MYSEALLDSLIQKIYEAALGAVGAAGWVSFLVCLAGALDSGFPTLYFVDPINQEGSLALSVGMDEKSIRDYGQYYHQRNVWIRGAAERDLLRPGIVRLSSDMCSRREFLRSEWYADFCRPHGMAQAAAATLVQERTMTSNIAVFADRDRPPYGQDDLRLLNALVPHLQRGLGTHLHVAASRARGEALEAVLNCLSTPALLVTATGKVLFMNSAAAGLIRGSDGLVLEDGVLRALLPGDTKSLRTLLAGAVQTSVGQGRQSGGTLKISRPHARESLELLISPLPSRQDDWLLRQPPMAAIFVTERARGAALEDSVLIRLHGLTPKEAKVAVAVSKGLSGKEICRELNISYNTLKTHLKHIYAKTGTRHQTGLARILAEGVRAEGADDQSTPA